MSLASVRLARGVKAALAWVAWDTKASFGGGAVPRQLHSTPGGLRPSTDQTVSSQVLDQRAWTSHLVEAASPSFPGGAGTSGRRRGRPKRPRRCGSAVSRVRRTVEATREEETMTTTTVRTSHLPVADLCAELGIARSTFYDWRAAHKAPRCIKLP